MQKPSDLRRSLSSVNAVSLEEIKKVKNMDKKEAKNALMSAKEFAQVSSAPLFSYEEAGLEKLEPEKKHTSWGAKLKLILKLAIFVVIFIKIVLESFKKLGNEKIQVLSTDMHNEYFY